MSPPIYRRLFCVASLLVLGLVAGAAVGEDYNVVEGVRVYLGVVPASVIREHPNDYPASVHDAVPSGSEQRYVTIALFDANSGQRITDAVVRARITGTAVASSEKTLQSMTIANALTYGNFFAMGAGDSYRITVHIYRPNLSHLIETQFQYKLQ